MTVYTFNNCAQAHNMTRTGFVTIPDQVYADQEAFDGVTFPAIYNGRKVRARLRGDEYGLHSSGTGDPVVAIISGAAASKSMCRRHGLA